jgi:hypothetical protein
MKQVELRPEERALIATARDGVEPTEVQRARVRRSLDAKIAAGVAAPVLATSAGLATLLKAGAGLAVAAVLGGGVVYLAGPRPSGPDETPKARPARPSRPTLPTPPQASATVPGPVTPTLPASAASETRSAPTRGPARRRAAPAARTTRVDLAGELGLLNQASAATRQGDVARADALLRAYDERYPSGELAQERAAAGVLAHCAAGRAQQARAEARRFLEHWPRSPLVVRIQGSCAGKGEAR